VVLAEKYQRLLQEYTALKANNAILKKGILTVRPELRLCAGVYVGSDAGSRAVAFELGGTQAQEANAALDNAVKVKDQKLRKVRAPTASLEQEAARCSFARFAVALLHALSG